MQLEAWHHMGASSTSRGHTRGDTGRISICSLQPPCTHPAYPPAYPTHNPCISLATRPYPLHISCISPAHPQPPPCREHHWAAMAALQ